MLITKTYKEHIIYTFYTFCKFLIRNATITAWRNRSRQRQKEISLDYLTEELHYSFGKTDEYFDTYGEYYAVRQLSSLMNILQPPLKVRRAYRQRY